MLMAVAAAWFGIAEAEARRLEAAAPGELAVRGNIKNTVHELFAMGDYAGLENIAGYYRSHDVRTPSGAAKLTLFYAAFHELSGGIGPNDSPAWQAFSAKIASWQGQFANQPTAFIVQAVALKSYAWSIRPRTFVREASTAGDAKFMAALRNTRAMLEQNRVIASTDPQFYALRASLSAPLGEAPDELMALTTQGRARFPDYLAIDFAGVDYFAAGDGMAAPGTDEAARIEAFARGAAVDPEADDKYARLYWHAYQVVYGNDLFRRSRADWPRMRAGFAAIQKHYPDAWNANHFALFACLAGDQAAAKSAFENLDGSEPPLTIWQSRAVVNGCRQWASRAISSRR